MPKVPILEPSVGYGTQTTPVPEVLRPPEGAFGADVAQATSRLGDVVANAGEEGFRASLQVKMRQDDQQVLDAQTQFQQTLQKKLINPEVDDNGIPKGYLSRQLNQAKGSTEQFDQDALELKKQYVDSVPGTLQKQKMNEILSAHLTNAREQVIQHEATQGQDAFMDSFKANQGTTIANAASLTEPASVMRAIDAAQTAAMPAYHHLGMSEMQVTAQNQELASQIVKSSITSLIEQDPNKAQTVLDASKGRMTPLAAAEMQNQITGKKLDQTILNVFDKAKTMRMDDGMIARTKVDAYVDTLGLTPQQTLQVKQHVDHLAMVDYSETMKKRQDSERTFTNELIAAQAKGVPYDEALKIPAKYSWDNTSMANMQADVTKIYASPADRFSTWISRQPQDVQGAWAEAQNTVKAKYGNTTGEVAGAKQKLSDAALTELKQDFIGKNADEIRAITKEKLDKVVIGPGAIWGSIWPNKSEGWKSDADTRQGLSEANALLERDYGKDRVSQAKGYLAEHGITVTPANLKKVIDKALEPTGDKT